MLRNLSATISKSQTAWTLLWGPADLLLVYPNRALGSSTQEYNSKVHRSKVKVNGIPQRYQMLAVVKQRREQHSSTTAKRLATLEQGVRVEARERIRRLEEDMNALKQRGPSTRKLVVNSAETRRTSQFSGEYVMDRQVNMITQSQRSRNSYVPPQHVTSLMMTKNVRFCLQCVEFAAATTCGGHRSGQTQRQRRNLSKAFRERTW